MEDEATLRLLGVHADSLRRIAKDEADHYEAHIERRLRRAGLGERELIELGISTGPVISQDGDVYGRTVNLAARISAYAQAGQVVVREETVRRSGGDGLRFEPLGAVALKGVPRPLPLYRAFRS